MSPYLISKKLVSAFLANATVDMPAKAGPCVVLGSAPRSSLPDGFDSTWSLWSVNASQCVAEKWGIGKPHITIMNGHIMGTRPHNIDAKRALRGKSTGFLVLVFDDMARLEPTRSQLAEIEYSFDELLILTPARRAKIAHRMAGAHIALGGIRQCSTGVFAAALALNQKNRPVVLSGLSLTANGHAYNDMGLRRKQTSEDHFALKRLSGRHKALATCDRVFAAESGLPVWSS